MRPDRDTDTPLPGLVDDEHEGDLAAAGPLPGMRLLREPRAAYFEPLNSPVWIPAAAAREMRADDFVLGISLGDSHFALPWWIMKNHHVANLQFRGLDMMVALCENCSSGAAFTAAAGGARLTFRVAGTFNGTFFVEDMESSSFWAPFTGEAIFGPHSGNQLEPLPLYQCYWSEWMALHPDTMVERGAGEPRDGHGSLTSPGSMIKNEKRMIKSAKRDRRLRPNVLVLGVRLDGASRAYPLDELYDAPAALNDSIAGRPIVVLSRPQSLLGMAFSRQLDGRVLHFDEISPLRYRDRETASDWDIEGKAFAGPLTGSRLEYVKSTIEEWYAFAAASRGEVEIFGSRAKDEIVAQPHLSRGRGD